MVGAPDVFWRFAPGWVSGHDEAGLTASMAQVGNLDFERAVQDCVAALDQLAGLPEVDASQRPGVIGFCLGGTIAFARHHRRFAVRCISYYGSGVPSMLDAIDDVNCPTLFHFGRTDSFIPFEGVELVAEAIGERDATSCSTSRRPGMPSTTTRRTCSTTRRPHGPHGPRRWPTSRSTCRCRDERRHRCRTTRTGPGCCNGRARSAGSSRPPIDVGDVPELARANAGAWREVLGATPMRRRVPAPTCGRRSSTPATCATCSVCTTSAWR